jgi:hypothetical protein
VANLSSPIRIVQTDFRSGELDPLLYMRVDSKIYPSGARTLRNCILRAGGSVGRRPGTTNVNIITGKARTIAFEFDVDEKYILAFGASRLEIFDGNGNDVVTFTGSTNCPWTTDARVTELTVAQAGDVMIICHTSFRPKVLRRTSLTTFTITDFNFTQSSNGAEIFQPYLKYEAATVTLSVSSTTPGTGRTITASASIFSSGWVGDTIRIFGFEITITGYTNTTTLTGTVKKAIAKRLDPNPFLSTDGSGVVEVTHAFHGMASGISITIAGAPEGAGLARANINGARTITEIIDEDRYTFTAGAGDVADAALDYGGAAVTIATTASTRDWDEQVFSARRGWPAACAFHEDRLWFGGSTTLPDGLFGSKTGLYYNFSAGDGEDDASIQVTLGSPRVARIKHILAGSVLQIFTEGAEFVVRQSDGQGITPSNISIRPQTPYGSGNIPPRSFDGATMFVQGNSKTVREFTFSDTVNSFQAVDVTTLSQHLLTDIVSMDVLYGSETRTEQYAFCVNNDGTMAVFHSNRSEGLAGWTPWYPRSGAFFESVCVLGSQVYVAVRSGVSTRTLERFEMDNADVTLDGSKAFSGTVSSNWTLGSPYVLGTFHVVSNGYYLGTVTADAGGNVTLPDAVGSFRVGFLYDWEIVPLPPDTSLPDGPMTGEKRRVSSVTIHTHETLSLSVDGKPVVTTEIGSDLSVPPAPISRKIRKYLLGYDRDPVFTLSQAAPLPVTILGMSMEVSQ